MDASVKRRWRSVAPVLSNYDDCQNCLAKIFDFGNGVLLGPAETWPISDKEAEGLSASDYVDFHSRRFAFAVNYTDGAEVDQNWKSREPKWKFETARYRIHYANLALWLTRITPLAHQLVFNQIESSPGVFTKGREWERWSPTLCSKREAKNHLQAGDLEVARTRFQTLYALGATGTVATTIGLLLKTISDGEPVSRFLSLWTCLESLAGPKGRSSVTHQLCERLALLLYGNSGRAFQAFHQLKKDYGMRSRVIHGLRTEEGDEEKFPEVFSRTEDWVRLTLGKIGDNPELAEKINGEGRDDFLSRLPFRQEPGPSEGGPVVPSVES